MRWFPSERAGGGSSPISSWYRIVCALHPAAFATRPLVNLGARNRRELSRLTRYRSLVGKMPRMESLDETLTVPPSNCRKPWA